MKKLSGILLLGIFLIILGLRAEASDLATSGKGHIEMTDTTMDISSSGGSIVINGKSYDVPDGASLSINANGVLVNGKPLLPTDESKPRPVLVITIKGNVQIVKDVKSVSITGDAGNVATTNGNITIGKNVTGAVTSVNGKISAESIAGPVSTVNGNIDKRLQ